MCVKIVNRINVVWTEISQSRFFCDEQTFRKILDESFVKSSYLPFLVHFGVKIAKNGSF